jgi:hypothetical protein
LVNPEWLDPTDTGAKRKKTNLTDPWTEYITCLDLAKTFHDDLKTNVHKHTYQFYSSGLATVDKVTFGHEEFFYRKQYALGIEYSEPSSKASSRGECTMFTDVYNQEILSPLSQPRKTFVASMSKITDFREGGDGTVPESSGGALKGTGILKVSRMKKYDHQGAYQKREARDFVITAIRNLALKRIEDEIKK